MNVKDWQDFLVRYNAELLRSADITRDLSKDVISSAWLGFPPASEEEITKKEQELGLILPSDLRSFYQITNGWRTTGLFIWDIQPVQNLGWLRDLEPHLYSIANDTEMTQGPFKNDPGDQRLLEFRYEDGTRVKRSLLLNSTGDAAYWLLDPEAKTGKELAAGRWSSWAPGMEWQAESFFDLMKRELESFVKLTA